MRQVETPHRASFSARRNSASKSFPSLADRALITAASAAAREAPKFASAEITSSSIELNPVPAACRH